MHRDYAVHGPPLRLTLAIYAGWKPPPKRRPEDDKVITGDDADMFFEAMTTGMRDTG